METLMEPPGEELVERSETPFTLGGQVERAIAGAKRRLDNMDVHLTNARSSLILPKRVDTQQHKRTVSLDEMKTLRDDIRTIRERFEAGQSAPLNALNRISLVSKYSSESVDSFATAMDERATPTPVPARGVLDEIVEHLGRLTIEMENGQPAARARLEAVLRLLRS